MTRRLIPILALAAVLGGLAAPAAALECYQCQPTMLCEQSCGICAEEHWEFGCIRWISSTCGEYGFPCGQSAATGSAPEIALAELFRMEPAAPQAGMADMAEPSH